MNIYSAAYTPGVDPRDLQAAAIAALPWKPDTYQTTDTQVIVGSHTNTLTAGQLSAWQTAVAAAATNPNAPWAIATAITNNITNALTQLRAIQTQAATFQAQAPYATANLANLNDLLGKTQQVAGAVAALAGDLIAVARYLTNQYDATT